jgi:hypothetical protein
MGSVPGANAGSRNRFSCAVSSRTGVLVRTGSVGGWLNRMAFGGVVVMMSVLPDRWNDVQGGGAAAKS